MPASSRASAGIAATLVAAILWGSSFSVNDIGLRHVGPGTFAFLRFALAAAVTIPVLRLFRGHKLARPPAWSLWLAAANALAFLLQYAAQTMTTPARTALFVNTSAFSVALLERILFGMRLGGARWLAILVGFGGAVVLIVGPDPDALLGGRAQGDALAMLAGFVWSVYFVSNDRAVERTNPVDLVAWTFAGTALFLAPAPLIDLWLGGAQRLDAAGAAAILYSGVFTTALAFALWTWGLTRIRASISAVLLMVEILVASLVSVALGRESFGIVDLVGAGLLLGAILLASAVASEDATKARPA